MYSKGHGLHGGHVLRPVERDHAQPSVLFLVTLYT